MLLHCNGSPRLLLYFSKCSVLTPLQVCSGKHHHPGWVCEWRGGCTLFCTFPGRRGQLRSSGQRSAWFVRNGHSCGQQWRELPWEWAAGGGNVFGRKWKWRCRGGAVVRLRMAEPRRYRRCSRNVFGPRAGACDILPVEHQRGRRRRRRRSGKWEVWAVGRHKRRILEQQPVGGTSDGGKAPNGQLCWTVAWRPAGGRGRFHLISPLNEYDRIRTHW